MARQEATQAEIKQFDQLLAKTPEVDPFCSSSDWTVPAQRTWGKGVSEAFLEPDAALLVAESRARNGARLWSGLDPIWGFACPLAGPDPLVAASLLARTLTAHSRRWDGMLLTGVPLGGELEAALVSELAGFRLQNGPEITRCVASLDGGWDGFLSRRSAVFRRNLRRAERIATSRGFRIEGGTANAEESVERAVTIEHLSWKARTGEGLTDHRFASFYHRIARQLTATGRQRASFALVADRDAGYILGAVRGSRYRGFQLSYDDRLAELSIGHLLQAEQIRGLVAEGIEHYDLGMDLAYKRAWAELQLTTRTIVVTRS